MTPKRSRRRVPEVVDEDLDSPDPAPLSPEARAALGDQVLRRAKTALRTDPLANAWLARGRTTSAREAQTQRNARILAQATTVSPTRKPTNRS